MSHSTFAPRSSGPLPWPALNGTAIPQPALRQPPARAHNARLASHALLLSVLIWGLQVITLLVAVLWPWETAE